MGSARRVRLARHESAKQANRANVHFCAGPLGRNGRSGSYPYRGLTSDTLLPQLTDDARSQMTAYALMTSPIPFPAFCIAFVIAGFGSGLVLSMGAAFIMKLPTRQNLKMCIFQAFYGRSPCLPGFPLETGTETRASNEIGVGALCAPLIATQFVGYTTRWRYYYLVSLGLATTSFGIIALVFRGKREHDLLPDLIETDSPAVLGEQAVVMPASSNVDTLKKMNQIMRVKAVHLLALWAFIYVGLEVSSSAVNTVNSSLTRDHSAGHDRRVNRHDEPVAST